MIYKCKIVTVSGVNGYTLHPYLGDDDIRIGEIDKEVYFYSEAPQSQHVDLVLEEVVLTDELREQLKALLPHKEFVRMKVSDIGDTKDLIADAMKLIEFNMMLTARMAGDIYGTNVLDEPTKELYKARNKAFLDAVDAGMITMRGDFDDMDVTMQRLLSRVSKTNETVRDNYTEKLKACGLM